MNGYNPKKHHRRSIRLKGYDYSQAGLYFITLCVQDRAAIFGEIQNGIMHLNIFGKIVQEEWEKTAAIRKNCTLGAYIIMPNHFHAILSIDYQIKKQENIGKFKSPSQTIGAIIRGFKGATTKRIKEIIINNPSAKSGIDLNNNNPRKGESGIDSNNPRSTGELQFAPTAAAPTAAAPTAPITLKTINFIKNKIALKKSIWQRDYWEHIIRNDIAYQRISNYIINNPKKWQEDKFHSK